MTRLAMTEIPDIVIKRMFEKLDNIDKVLHEQCKRISRVEAGNKLVAQIWKKIIAALSVTSTVIGILVVLN